MIGYAATTWTRKPGGVEARGGKKVAATSSSECRTRISTLAVVTNLDDAYAALTSDAKYVPGECSIGHRGESRRIRQRISIDACTSGKEETH